MIDFDSILSPALQSVFGQPSTYTRAADDSVLTPTVILDMGETAQIGARGGFLLTIRDSDFGVTPPHEGDVVVIDQGTFNVVEVTPNATLPPDGAGMRTLTIRRQS